MLRAWSASVRASSVTSDFSFESKSLNSRFVCSLRDPALCSLDSISEIVSRIMTATLLLRRIFHQPVANSRGVRMRGGQLQHFEATFAAQAWLIQPARI